MVRALSVSGGYVENFSVVLRVSLFIDIAWVADM